MMVTEQPKPEADTFLHIHVDPTPSPSTWPHGWSPPFPLKPSDASTVPRPAEWPVGESVARLLEGERRARSIRDRIWKSIPLTAWQAHRPGEALPSALKQESGNSIQASEPCPHNLPSSLRRPKSCSCEDELRSELLGAPSELLPGSAQNSRPVVTAIPPFSPASISDPRLSLRANNRGGSDRSPHELIAPKSEAGRSQPLKIVTDHPDPARSTGERAGRVPRPAESSCPNIKPDPGISSSGLSEPKPVGYQPSSRPVNSSQDARQSSFDSALKTEEDHRASSGSQTKRRRSSVDQPPRTLPRKNRHYACVRAESPPVTPVTEPNSPLEKAVPSSPLLTPASKEARSPAHVNLASLRSFKNSSRSQKPRSPALLADHMANALDTFHIRHSDDERSPTATKRRSESTETDDADQSAPKAKSRKTRLADVPEARPLEGCLRSPQALSHAPEVEVPRAPRRLELFRGDLFDPDHLPPLEPPLQLAFDTFVRYWTTRQLVETLCRIGFYKQARGDWLPGDWGSVPAGELRRYLEAAGRDRIYDLLQATHCQTFDEVLVRHSNFNVIYLTGEPPNRAVRLGRDFGPLGLIYHPLIKCLRRFYGEKNRNPNTHELSKSILPLLDVSPAALVPGADTLQKYTQAAAQDGIVTIIQKPPKTLGADDKAREVYIELNFRWRSPALKPKWACQGPSDGPSGINDEDVVCYACSEKGHVKSACPKSANNKKSSPKKIGWTSPIERS